ncbi:MAG TPA: GDP-mannose 4,6-dehydratase [Polyangiaceae bacterium LLY-WYZ-15_(1-7)]|nr:NAD-dependent dehydratase [Myxococcales bacterium]MAT28411.1 NAD-dependent dehydratase [Sandaracinus sp.]HJL03820.1 GDP-mannose 4,6-dehydratase [Polyangiaceae bacterium LLY-WYZ-15_(1-7)]MBJ70378.1 NAD-dependent dehydratase [Sandaracinus sp.]HJL07556.1 GDP-mannose 4,6-dehydratase [Polyangiaceae bacterium LLY-WYZ-15_(1-7)]
MPRILVTGGAGFVGSHLVDRLLADGHQVVALDSFVTGRVANIAHLAHHPRFALVEHDVIAPWPSLGRFDRVYNLASPASPPKYQRDPIFTLRTNVEGTLRALEKAEHDGARFLQASTSECYGDPEVHPQPETYRGAVSTLGPRACYDEGKRAAEALCADFVRARGVDARIVRIFNTYGPRMDPGDGRVVTNFVHQALRGEPLTLYGGGRQTRSFCYVDDLVRGLVAYMEHGSPPPVLNLGNDTEHTIAELAVLVRELVAADVPLVGRPLPKDDPTRRRPDLRRARTALGYRPRVSLREGLARTLAHAQAELAPRRRVA